MLDLSGLAQLGQVLLAAVVTAAVPVFLQALRKWVGLKADAADEAQFQAASASITAAAARGAGLAYEAIVSSAGTIADPIVRNTAVSIGVNHVLTALPDALKAMGVTPEAVTRLVAAELGKLLAMDPTVTVVPTPPPALVPVQVPAPPPPPIPVTAIGDKS